MMMNKEECLYATRFHEVTHAMFRVRQAYSQDNIWVSSKAEGKRAGCCFVSDESVMESDNPYYIKRDWQSSLSGVINVANETFCSNQESYTNMLEELIDDYREMLEGTNDYSGDFIRDEAAGYFHTEGYGQTDWTNYLEKRKATGVEVTFEQLMEDIVETVKSMLSFIDSVYDYVAAWYKMEKYLLEENGAPLDTVNIQLLWQAQRIDIITKANQQ